MPNSYDPLPEGDVTGPLTSTPGNIAVFDSTTGKLIADSTVAIDDVQLSPIAVSDLPQIYAAKIVRNTAQTISDSTETAISFNATRFDYGSFVSGSTLVVPSGKGGLYSIRASALFATNITGIRQLIIKKGTDVLVRAQMDASGNGGVTGLSASVDEVLAAGDVITAAVFQNSTGNLDLLGNVDPDFNVLSMFQVR